MTPLCYRLALAIPASTICPLIFTKAFVMCEHGEPLSDQMFSMTGYFALQWPGSVLLKSEVEL